MFTVTEYEGVPYSIRDRRGYTLESRKDYIRIEWDTGHIDMKRSVWEKLSKAKKKKFFSTLLQK